MPYIHVRTSAGRYLKYLSDILPIHFQTIFQYIVKCSAGQYLRIIKLLLLVCTAYTYAHANEHGRGIRVHEVA